LVFRSSFLYLVFGAQTLSRLPSQHSRRAPFGLPECTTFIAVSIVRSYAALAAIFQLLREIFRHHFADGI
jgi:hypothetical protein